MKRLLKYSLASLVVCLCLSVAATPDGQTKKFRIQGHVEGYITGPGLVEGSFTTHEVDIGQNTFSGRHVNEFDTLYTPTGEVVDGVPVFFVTMAGESTGANLKGAIQWVGVNSPVPTVTFTGGWGPWSGVQGGFTSTVYNLQMNPDGTLSYDYIGTGEITFAPK